MFAAVAGAKYNVTEHEDLSGDVGRTGDGVGLFADAGEAQQGADGHDDAAPDVEHLQLASADRFVRGRLRDAEQLARVRVDGQEESAGDDLVDGADVRVLDRAHRDTCREIVRSTAA